MAETPPARTTERLAGRVTGYDAERRAMAVRVVVMLRRGEEIRVRDPRSGRLRFEQWIERMRVGGKRRETARGGETASIIVAGRVRPKPEDEVFGAAARRRAAARGVGCMNMCVALLRQALRTLDEGTLSAAMHGGARAAVRALEGLSRGVSGGATAPGADDWSLPDALWTAACEQHPELRYYPLGECCERAFKKAILDRLPPEAVAVAAPEAGSPRRAGAARGADAARGEHEIVARFLRHFFFEMCVDRLRRPGPRARGYHFSKDGRMLSLDAEALLRGRLADQCAALARDYVARTRGATGRRPLDDRKIGAACEALLGARPAPAPARPAGSWLNVVEGPAAKKLAALPSAFTLAPRPTRLLLHDPRYNVSFSFEPFQSWLGRPPRSLVKDLLDLGVAVYVSDLYTSRDAELARRIGLLVSVRHPDRWSPARDPIRRAVAQLGRDAFDVHFVKRREPTQDGDFSVGDDGRCVCLFSGGLDSAAGAVWALENGLRPVLVSHYAQPQLSGIQDTLAETLCRRYGRRIEHVGFFAAKRADRAARDARHRPSFALGSQRHSVMAQHLRSFLFLTAAAAVAIEAGIRRVYVFENGPVALNPLVCEGRINTHTAHPHVLEQFRTMVRLVFGVDLEIANPFAYLTKGEVAGLLAQARVPRLVGATCSCWNWFNVPMRAKKLGRARPGQRHDGDCLPCVLRRAAVHAAGLERHDAAYLVDVFGEYPGLEFDAGLGIADLLRFCRNVLAADDAALLRRVPELSVSSPGSDPRRLAAMLRRHAAEVRDAFRAGANPAFRRDFAAVL